MNPDFFRYDQGAASAVWPALDIRIDFDLLRSDRRSGETSAEVSVLSTRSGENGVIHRARLPLLSTVARSAFAKHLAGRVAEKIDWLGLLEAGCTRTLDAHRNQSPAILLREAEIRSEQPYLLAPLILDQHLTIWFADGGTLKSYLALAAGLSLHTGDSLMGLKPTRRLRVGLLDWEFDGGEHHARMRRLMGPGELPDLVYKRCDEPLYDMVDAARAEIRKHELEFLILDSVAFGCDGPPEESETARRYISAVRRLGLPALAIAHITKGGDDQKPFGSSFWHHGARMTWYLEKQQEPGDADLEVCFQNRKANTTQTQPPVAFRLTFGGTRTLVEQVAASTNFGSKVPNRIRIAEALHDGRPRTYEELGERLGLAPDVVRVTVRRHPKQFLRDESSKPHRVALLDRQHSHPNSSPNTPEQFGEDPNEHHAPLRGVFGSVSAGVGG